MTMIKFNYPEGTHCYRAIHTVHAVYYDNQGKLVARAEKPDRSAMYEFEIESFETLKPGTAYS